MSGCAVCVYDLYAAALEDYKHALEALRSALEARGVPEREWPVEVRRNDNAEAEQSARPTPQNVALSAFEELERSLRAKREANAAEVPGQYVFDLPILCSPIIFDNTTGEAIGAVRSVPKKRRRAHQTAAALYEGLRWLIFSKK